MCIIIASSKCESMRNVFVIAAPGNCIKYIETTFTADLVCVLYHLEIETNPATCG